MVRPALFVTLLLIWLPLFGQDFGQQPSQSQSPSSNPPAPTIPERRPAPPPQELAKVTARTDLVLVPVVVTDKSGKHVPGLQKEAFRIQENGKVRNISVFEEVKTEKLVVHRKDVAPDSYSNFLPGDAQTWRMTAIVLDMINTPMMRQLEAKKQLVDFLLRSASRDEPMAIFGLSGSGLHQRHSFTTDTKILVEALQKLKLSLSSQEATQPPDVFDDSSEEQASDEEQLMSDFMQDLSDSISAEYQHIATRQTLLGMTQLAHALEAIPRRTTLICASAGFPFTIDDPRSFARQGDELQGEYEEVWRALKSANIAVYPVDLSAMEFRTKDLPSANTGISSRQLNNIQGKNGLKSGMQLPYDKSAQQQLTLHSFADATGGRACITVEELDKCFGEAVDDSRAYYMLGYYLGEDTQPGWRKLKVKVEGDGIHERYRSGFYVAPKIEDSVGLRRQQLADALASPVQYTGLRLTARLEPPLGYAPPASAPNQKRHAKFMLGVMGNSLTVNREKNDAIDLEVIAIAWDSNRKVAGTAAQVIATELTPERLQRISETGMGIPEKLDLAPGKYEVKFAVRDNLSGHLATVSVPIELK
jgi:VWFA-related protein